MEPQAIEGYACSCGKNLETLKAWRSHSMTGNNQEGKGTHLSAGRVNMQTGQITMPPWKDRTPEQKRVSRIGQKTPTGEDKSGGQEVKPKLGRPQIAQTDSLGLATSVNFVPRVFTTTYTPIMQASQVASVELWGWPKMSLEDFLDTVLYLFFKDRGVTLQGYFINETDEERAAREAMLNSRGNGGPAPLPAEVPAGSAEAVLPEPAEDVRLLAFKKMVERLADNKTITGEDMFDIMEEVSSDASSRRK